MKEFDLYVKNDVGKWSCRGSYPTKELAVEMKDLRHKYEECFIKESEKKRSYYELC